MFGIAYLDVMIFSGRVVILLPWLCTMRCCVLSLQMWSCPKLFHLASFGLRLSLISFSFAQFFGILSIERVENMLLNSGSIEGIQKMEDLIKIFITLHFV